MGVEACLPTSVGETHEVNVVELERSEEFIQPLDKITLSFRARNAHLVDD